MLVELPRYPVAAEIKWRLRQPSQANRSEFTGRRRVTILAEAPRWAADVKYPPIVGEENVRHWRAALARLQGRIGAFRLGASEGPQRGVGPQPVVDGAGQVGTTLKLRGAYPGSFLRPGWFVTVADRLHQVVEQSVAGPDGRMSVAVVPYVAGYGDGAFVDTVRPFALMSLAEDEAGWTVGPGQKYEISFTCEEAF